MSYSNYNLPGVGSNTYSYSYTSTNSPPKVSTQTYTTDSFAKPSTNYGLTTSYSTGFPSSTTNYTSYSVSGSSPSTYTTSSYTTGGYGNTSFSSVPQTYPSVSTTSYTTPSATSYTTPSVSNYSVSLSGPQTYANTSNYSTSVAAPSTSSYGLASSALGGYGGSFSTQQASFGKPSISAPVQPTSYSSNVSYNPPSVGISASASSGACGSACSSADTSKYEATVRQLKSSGQKYTDPEFPTQLRSLTGGLSEEELAAGGNPLNWSGLVWLRADEIYGKGNYQIFQGKIEPDDIKQGALGDCYFLSTLASIAEKSDRIKRLFVTDTPSEQGCYGIRICDGGIWQTIMLDDYFPCSGKSKQPCFTTGNGNEIWVQLLEKAWAKVYGSYARIEAGLTRECLHDLTGAPTKYYLTDDESKHPEIWDTILTGEKRNYIMTCGAGDFFEGADLMSEIGLVGSHAYSLLSAAEITDRYGKKVRLVKLRNPWGKGEWTGDWSDESALWTPELKRELGIEDRDDGDFWMSFEDLMKYFSDIQICKIHDDFKYHALKATCNARNGVFFKINVKVGGHYFVTVNQESTRKHAESENYRYSETFLVMGKKVGNGYQYVEGINKADKEVWTDGHLEAGEYIVYAKIAWNDRRPKEFALSCYGKGDVEISVVPKSYVGDFIEKVYINKGRQSKKFEDYQHCGVSNCYRSVELTDDGFGYIYYKNDSNKTLEEEINFTVLEGLKLKKPYKGNSYKISVPPGQERIAVTKIIPGAPKIRQAFSERSRFV